MDLAIAGAVLFSAVLHAGWNALVKVNAQPLHVLTLMCCGSALVGLAMIPFVGVLPTAAWPFFALTLALHFGYKLLLVQAYRHGDFSQTYPIARGGAPLLVAAGGFWLAGERLAACELLAVCLLAAGVLVLALQRGAVGHAYGARPVLYALATALCIAAYSVVDALGARAAGSPHVFVAWLFVVDAVPMLALVWLRERATFVGVVRSHWRIGAAGGLMTVIAYWIVVWAMTQTSMGIVSALRETSVVFAAVLSVLFLRERIDGLRAASIALVVAGLVLLRW